MLPDLEYKKIKKNHSGVGNAGKLAEMPPRMAAAASQLRTLAWPSWRLTGAPCEHPSSFFQEWSLSMMLVWEARAWLSSTRLWLQSHEMQTA